MWRSLSRSRVSRSASPVRYHPNEPPRWPGSNNAGSTQQAGYYASGQGNVDHRHQMVTYLNAVPHIQRDSGGSFAFMAQSSAHPPQQSYPCDLPLASPVALLPTVPLAGGSINVAPGTASYADGSMSVAGGSIGENHGEQSGSMAGWQPSTLSRSASMAARLVEPVISNARSADEVRPALSLPPGPALAPDGRQWLEPRPASDLKLLGWQSPGKGYIAPLEPRRSPSPGIQQSWRRVEHRRAASPPARPSWGPRVVEVKRYPSPSPQQQIWATEGRLLSRPLEAQTAAQPWQPQLTPPRRRSLSRSRDMRYVV